MQHAGVTVISKGNIGYHTYQLLMEYWAIPVYGKKNISNGDNYLLGVFYMYACVCVWGSVRCKWGSGDGQDAKNPLDATGGLAVYI